MNNDNTIHSVLVSILLAASTVGCDKDNKDRFTPPGGCNLPESGSVSSVSAGSPLTFDTYDSMAMNTMDFDYDAQLAGPQHGILRIGPCGDAGLLMRIGEGGSADLVFTDPRADGAIEVVDDAINALSSSASLFYESDCSPIVVRASSSDGFVQYDASGGIWTPSVVLADLSTVLGTAPSSLSLQAATVGADGNFHLFHTTGWDGAGQLMHSSRAPAAGSSWSFEELPMPEATIIYGFWVDLSGSTHTVYRNTDYPCDPCNVDTYHAQIGTGDSEWATDTVHQGSWGDPHDEFIESASMAFDSLGTRYIAAHIGQRVVTGSYRYTQLVLFGGLPGGAWCGETVESKNAGFAGTDGTGYTGAHPTLLIDDDDVFHVVFCDQSIWHDSSGWQNEMRGQIRHAVRTGDSWIYTTLLSQVGQTESPEPLHGLGAPSMALSSDGTELVAAASLHTWSTDSIYNDTDVPVTYTAQAVTATID